MKQKPESRKLPFSGVLATIFSDRLIRRTETLSLVVSAVLCVIVYIAIGTLGKNEFLKGYEVGQVADRDIVADRDTVYVDERATAVRLDAERRLVPPIFVVDDKVSRDALAGFESFRRFFLDLAAARGANGGRAGGDTALMLMKAFPSFKDEAALRALAGYPSPNQAFAHSGEILAAVLKSGVLSLPDRGLESYNPDTVEIRTWNEGSLSYEQVQANRVVSGRNLAQALEAATASRKLPRPLPSIVVAIVAAFVTENAFFDDDQSRKRLDAADKRVEPVMRRIAKGERIIRKGFLVTNEAAERLAAIRKSQARLDAPRATGGGLLILVLFGASVLVLKPALTGITLGRQTFILVLGMGFSYFILSASLGMMLPPDTILPRAAFLPTGLFSILLAIILSERFAVVFSMILSMTVLVGGSLDAQAAIAVLASGLAGTFLVRRTEKRIDLVRAGVQLAGFQAFITLVLLAYAGADFVQSLQTAIWFGFNGFFCGILSLGFLPVLEQALNAPTVFRLQELSDLNTSVLKRLLTVAPGTYSHSVTVAHLAESACREMGANALLARVGAYYHDIGKIEQPEYFIENQAGYNKHDEISPRLSATVLRSHVKFGIERARTLGLPNEVVSIIAEHHGTSLMVYFFNQAQKTGSDTGSEDFLYPGPLPSGKEAGVVMLADCVEAASRTLKKPSMNRLEQFVAEIIAEKLAQGQLVDSALTFRDLECVKNTFMRILAGHFHSRIEYPRQREQGR